MSNTFINVMNNKHFYFPRPRVYLRCPVVFGQVCPDRPLCSSSPVPGFEDTIFALSSGRGRCGVAVVRVSGPDAAVALRALTGLKRALTPRTALLRSITHPKSQELLDRGLVLWFPGACSGIMHCGDNTSSSVLLQVYGQTIMSIMPRIEVNSYLYLHETGEVYENSTQIVTPFIKTESQEWRRDHSKPTEMRKKKKSYLKVKEIIQQIYLQQLYKSWSGLL